MANTRSEQVRKMQIGRIGTHSTLSASNPRCRCRVDPGEEMVVKEGVEPSTPAL